MENQIDHEKAHKVLPPKSKDDLNAAGPLALQFIGSCTWGITAYTSMGAITNRHDLTLPLCAVLGVFLALSGLVVSRWWRQISGDNGLDSNLHKSKTYGLLSVGYLFIAILVSICGLLVSQTVPDSELAAIWIVTISIIPALAAGLTFNKSKTIDKNDRGLFWRELKTAVISLGGLIKV